MSIVVTGANRHDVTQIEPVLKNRIRKPRGRTQQNLCADAGYSGKKSENIMRAYHYTPHIRPRGEEKIAIQHGFKARRWIVEVVHGSIISENFLCAMKKQIPPTNRYYSLLQVLLFLENQLLFRDRFLEALPRRRTERETPPRAWGRPESSGDTWQYGRNTPTGVGKRARLTLWRLCKRKHPHGRGEERESLF